MSWFRSTKEPEILVGNPDDAIPCDDPTTAVIVSPPDPEPDFATKPEDVVGYCFGYVCPKKHVNSTFDNITVDGYKERRACQTCGGIAKPSVVKRTAEAQWGDCWYPSYALKAKPDWRWYNSFISGFGKSQGLGDILWTKYQFVHYLDTPKPRKKKR